MAAKRNAPAARPAANKRTKANKKNEEEALKRLFASPPESTTTGGSTSSGATGSTSTPLPSPAFLAAVDNELQEVGSSSQSTLELPGLAEVDGTAEDMGATAAEVEEEKGNFDDELDDAVSRDLMGSFDGAAPSFADALFDDEISAAQQSPQPSLFDEQHQKPARSYSVVDNVSSALSASSMTPCCIKCQLPTDVLKAIIKCKSTPTRAAKFVCRSCNNVQTMINRKLCMDGELSLSNLNPAVAADFWRKAGSCKDDDRLVYERIRNVLTEVWTQQKIQENSNKVSTEFLPLGVWAARGFPIEEIRSYNLTKLNPALGLCYGVPVQKMTWSEQERNVRELIHQAESKVRRKSGSDIPALEDDNEPAEAAPAPPKTTPAIDKAAQAAKAKQEAAASKAAEKEAKKAADAEARRIKNANSKAQILASRTIAALTAPHDEIQKCMKMKEYSMMPEIVTTKVQSVSEEASKCLSEANEIVKTMKKVAKTGEEVQPLTFDQSTLQSLSKNFVRQ